VTNTPENLVAPTTNNPSPNFEAEIYTILNEIMSRGANDFEPSAIENILQDLRAGKVTGEKAVQLAKNILASKQDYH
jgi:hypothetical protein